ncbi:hypothetical protein GGI24_003470 [Coemansia furcata]|nr:hypothetical protein GGI24_003470 [Coemansia furcata]
MEPVNGLRYSVYETTTRTSSPMVPRARFLAAVKRLLCFGKCRRTSPSLRLASSASRMNLALAVAEQYVLVSLDNPLDDADQTAANTPAAGTPTMQCSPMSGISDNTLRSNVYCDAALDGSKPRTGRRSLAFNSLWPKSLRSNAVSPSYRSSTICEHRVRNHSDSHLNGSISPAIVAARENPLFC